MFHQPHSRRRSALDDPAHEPGSDAGLILGVTSSSTTTSSTTSSTAATGRLVMPNGVVTNGSVRAITNPTGAVTITNMPAVVKSK